MEPQELFWKHNGGATIAGDSLEFSLFNKPKTVRLSNHPGIFLDFAALESTESILEFTKDYGNLDLVPTDCQSTFRESLSTWRAVGTLMRRAVGIWQNIQDRDVIKLREFLNLEVSPIERDLVSHARKNIEESVNSGLALVQNVIRYDADADTMLLVQSPTTLRGVMWLQFTRWIRGISIKRCALPTCKKWFSSELDYEKKYCCATCRRIGLANRKKLAESMSSEGKSVKQIAAALDRDVDVIKTWLSKK